MNPFFPVNTLSDCLQIFVKNSSRKKCQMNVTLQLKLCESQQVLFNGMCAYAVFWFWFAWIHPFSATGSDKSTKPTPNPPPFILASCWNHSKHSALVFENKKVWLTPTFFQLYAISNSTDFSVSLISEELNWHKLKTIQHWISSLRLKRCITMISVHWPLWNEYGDFSSAPICST